MLHARVAESCLTSHGYRPTRSDPARLPAVPINHAARPFVITHLLLNALDDELLQTRIDRTTTPNRTLTMLSLARTAALPLARPRAVASFARAAASIHTLPKLDYAYDVRRYPPSSRISFRVSMGRDSDFAFLSFSPYTRCPNCMSNHDADSPYTGSRATHLGRDHDPAPYETPPSVRIRPKRR